LIETELSSLDSILKDSLAKSSSHTRRVYSQNPLTASEVVDLANSRVLTIAATVRPDSRPHVSPSDLVVVDGTFYLGVDKLTARYKNLRHNPAVTVMLADGWKRQAILEGTASFLDMKSETAKKVLTAQKKKYGWVTDLLAEFKPTKVFTWKGK
jgi:putative heme iron utilization protein